MKVLVTGGTGFTGKALALRLLDLGHEVVALDLREGWRTGELRDRGARVVLGSVTDRALVRQCLEGVEVVFHLAAAFRETGASRRRYREVNTDGTGIVAEEARRAGVAKLVYCSTCGVHGNVERPPAAENAPIAPADYYQETKYAGEERVAAEQRLGLRAAIVRPAAIYGPGDPGRFLMIFRRVARGVFPIFGGGRTLYHPLYIDNLVDGFLLLMPPGAGDGGTFLLADERYVTIEELVRATAAALGVAVRTPHFPLWPLIAAGHVCETVCRPFGIPPPIFPRRVDWYRQNRAFDIEKARRELGYAPRVALAEGLRRTGDWYRREGLL